MTSPQDKPGGGSALPLALTLSLALSLGFAFGMMRVHAYTRQGVSLDQAGILHWTTLVVSVGWAFALWYIARRRQVGTLVSVAVAACAFGFGGLYLWAALSSGDPREAPGAPVIGAFLVAGGASLSLLGMVWWVSGQAVRTEEWTGGSRFLGWTVVGLFFALTCLVFIPRSMVSTGDSIATATFDGVANLPADERQRKVVDSYREGELSRALGWYERADFTPFLGEQAACRVALITSIVGNSAVAQGAPEVALEAYERCASTECMEQPKNFLGRAMPKIAAECARKLSTGRRLKGLYPAEMLRAVWPTARWGEAIVVVTKTGVWLDHERIAYWKDEPPGRIDARVVEGLVAAFEKWTARLAKSEMERRGEDGSDTERFRDEIGRQEWTLLAERATPWIRVADLLVSAAVGGRQRARVPVEWLGTEASALELWVDRDQTRALRDGGPDGGGSASSSAIADILGADGGLGRDGEGTGTGSKPLLLTVLPEGYRLTDRKLVVTPGRALPDREPKDLRELYASAVEVMEAATSELLQVRVKRSLDFESFARLAHLLAYKLATPLPPAPQDLVGAPRADWQGSPVRLFRHLSILPRDPPAPRARRRLVPMDGGLD